MRLDDLDAALLGDVAGIDDGDRRREERPKQAVDGRAHDEAAVRADERAVEPDADPLGASLGELHDEGAQLLGQREVRLQAQHLVGRDRREVDRVADHALRQVVAHGGRGFEADQLLRLGRRRRDVRRGDDLWQLGQAPVLRRLDFEDVERRARDVARFDRVGQRVLVDELAARGVDDPHATLALRQTGRAEEVTRLGRRRNVEADVVGDLTHAVEDEQLDAERRPRPSRR